MSRHQDCGLIRRIIDAVQGHREAALHTTVPPRLNIVLNLLLLILVELGVAANLHAVPAATHTLNGLTHRKHRGVVEGEPVGLEHRLLTHLKHAQARATISTSPSLTDAQSRRNPTVAAGLQHPTFDDVLPSARITHRVAGSQAHRTHRAVSNGRPAVGRENHLLVAASREVGEGIVRAVVLQQGTDLQFFFAIPLVGGTVPASQLVEGQHEEETIANRSDEAHEVGRPQARMHTLDTQPVQQQFPRGDVAQLRPPAHPAEIPQSESCQCDTAHRGRQGPGPGEASHTRGERRANRHKERDQQDCAQNRERVDTR